LVGFLGAFEMTQPSPARIFSVPILSLDTWRNRKRQAYRTQKQLALIALVLLGLIGLLPSSWSHGGTNGLLDRMLKMTNEMEQTGEIKPEEAVKMRLKVQELRDKVDERMQRGGGISPKKDKDLYDEIDAFNKPLFDAYQQSKAKDAFDPRKHINDFPKQ
jgi:hypothetical protein